MKFRQYVRDDGTCQIAFVAPKAAIACVPIGMDRGLVVAEVKRACLHCDAHWKIADDEPEICDGKPNNYHWDCERVE